MTDYRYERFRRQNLVDDLSFGAGQEPGWQMPDFDLPTVSGGHVRKADFMGQRPVLLTFASITDPMAASAAPILKRLYRELGERVAFVTVYVREAHPGDVLRQPDTLDAKMRHARMLRDRDGLPWTVAVDDVDGSFHRALGGNCNAAYVMDPNGNVAFRTLWSNDGRILREALSAVAEGRSDHPFERERRVVPIVRGLSRVDEVVRAAGPRAVEDFRREAPVVFAAGELAWLWRALTPLGRLTVAASALGVLLAGWRGLKLLRPARGT